MSKRFLRAVCLRPPDDEGGADERLRRSSTATVRRVVGECGDGRRGDAAAVRPRRIICGVDDDEDDDARDDEDDDGVERAEAWYDDGGDRGRRREENEGSRVGFDTAGDMEVAGVTMTPPQEEQGSMPVRPQPWGAAASAN